MPVGAPAISRGAMKATYPPRDIEPSHGNGMSGG
jgi:hypothetical protein